MHEQEVPGWTICVPLQLLKETGKIIAKIIFKKSQVVLHNFSTFLNDSVFKAQIAIYVRQETAREMMNQEKMEIDEINQIKESSGAFRMRNVQL